MIAVRCAVAAAALALATAAAAERVVDYTIDEAAARQAAADQGIAFAPLPARGGLHVAVAIAPDVDHDVVRVGIYCSAWKVRNDMAPLLQRFLAAWDRDGAPAAVGAAGVDRTVTIARAATLNRCVASGEMRTACITRVTIAGSVADRDGTARPFRIEREQPTRVGGVCGNLARGIGLVSRSAAAAMVEAVAAPAAPGESPAT